MSVTINGTTGVTTPALNTSAGTVNFDSLSAANSVIANTHGFQRNRIINGAMMIDQRNAGASVTPSSNGTYFVDRWRTSQSQNSKYTAQQNAGAVTPPSGFTNYLGITSSSAYSVLTGDYIAFGQRIEGFNAADLGWGAAGAQSITLSFWVRSSLTGTFGGALGNASSTRSYPFTYTITAANTWEQKSITISGDTSGTWNTTNNVGIALYFNLGTGSTLSGTAGAWAGADYVNATGSVNLVATSGATLYITGVQLEAGSVATPFEYRQYGQELALCQRYYEISNFVFAPGVASYGYMNGFWKAEKRTTPTITLTNSGGATVFASGTSSYYQAGNSSGSLGGTVIGTAEL